MIKYFKDAQAELNSCIENVLWSKPVTVDGQIRTKHGVCEGVEYDDFEILNIIVRSDIHSIDYHDGKALFMSLNVKAEIEVACSYFDEKNSAWDAEEQDYLYKACGHIIEKHEISFLAKVVCEIENERIGRKTIKPLLQRRLVLDRATLKKRFPLDLSAMSKFYEHLACKCGHYITVNLIDYEEDKTVTERGMGAETAHHVAYEDFCPNCGRKFKISGAIYEYPSGCFNYKDINTEWDAKN